MKLKLVYCAVFLLSSFIFGIVSSSLSIGLLGGVAATVALVGFHWHRFQSWVRHPLTPPDDDLGPFRSVAHRFSDSLWSARRRSRTLLSLSRRFRSISDNLPDAWVMLNNDLEIETINRAAEALFGLSTSDIGRSFLALARHPSYRSLIESNDRFRVIEIPSPVDDTIRLEVRLVDVEGGNIVIARDVTDLNRLLSMRQDFVANVSHELRTPLTVLIGYIEALLTEEMSASTVKEILGRLETPAQRMKSLADDLLTLTRLESSPEPDPESIHQVDGGGLIHAVVKEVAPLSTEAHNIVVDADEKLIVEGVSSEIHSAFMNLLSNAIRYSPSGGTIRLSWHRTSEGARFEICDEGIGMAPEHISRITERFYRIDLAGSRAKGGTGLGLAIVKHVLLRHRSQLDVKSVAGVGSTFGFTLPIEFGAVALQQD